MTQIAFLTDWARDVVGVTFWVCVAFPLVVSFVWPWWKSEWGWNIILLEAAIALTLLRGVLISEFGFAFGSLPLLWVAVLSLTLVPIVVVWRGFLIIRTQLSDSTPVTAKEVPDGTHADDCHG